MKGKTFGAMVKGRPGGEDLALGNLKKKRFDLQRGSVNILINLGSQQ